MKLTIIVLSALFCFFLYRLLELYIPGDSWWVTIAIFLGIVIGIILGTYKPKEDTHTFKDIEINEVGIDFEQEARIEKTRIASEKRKARRNNVGNK